MSDVYAELYLHAHSPVNVVSPYRARSRATIGGARPHVPLVSSRGEGTLGNTSGEIATFRAASQPGLGRVGLSVAQGDVVCNAEAQITMTASLLPKGAGDSSYQGLPGYTFQIDFAARGKMLKSRYICRLFAKELVLRNFGGIPPHQRLERLLEVTLYTDENLR